MQRRLLKTFSPLSWAAGHVLGQVPYWACLLTLLALAQVLCANEVLGEACAATVLSIAALGGALLLVAARRTWLGLETKYHGALKVQNTFCATAGALFSGVVALGLAVGLIGAFVQLQGHGVSICTVPVVIAMTGSLAISFAYSLFVKRVLGGGQVYVIAVQGADGVASPSKVTYARYLG